MATIRDVAKEAGVSVATVSRVINSNGYVNEETKKKVEKAIQLLNYKPNAVARSLFKKQSMTIGLIIPDITNPFFPQLARAVEDVTNEKGYTIILGNSDESSEKEQEYLDIFEQKYVDGIILATNTLTVEQIASLGKPVVAVDRPIDSGVPTVVAEHRRGAQAAVRHLLDTGCQTIAHIRGPEHVVSADERCKGYLDIVKDKPWFSDQLVINGHYAINDAYKAASELIKDRPDVDGIFAGNDLMAIGALKAARELGKKVPEELAIIGFDGIDMCETTFPELSTMVQPIYELGATAANMLIELIENRRVNQQYYEYPVQLKVRNSSRGRPPKDVNHADNI
ncbi:LacI family transcriptional regulator [Scopulibacillus daqui]|uniref:LacI family transcriptional regulator n=1 Tax=Scopulibacillus daqui TaxID=1469162 RepID=A0ABS2Q4L5_9BACL|nr:LacI family DNA-binding transcriptional regulator [Scopulibacillus daqui]MBM7646639.1 LacI family transcriptional regulator [Scopulibacillus daqui]